MERKLRTPKKAEEHKAVRKTLSMRQDIWGKADRMADVEGNTRSAIVAQAIELL